MNMRKLSLPLIFAAVFMALGLNMAWAATDQSPDMRYFAKLPVVHEGRVKPLSHAAAITLQKISGADDTLTAASQTLAAILFDPAGATDARIFRVEQPGLQHALALDARDPPLYSFREMNDAFVAHAELVLSLRQSAPSSLTDDQAALLRLYAQVTYFEQLKGAMTLLLPLKSKEAAVSRLIDLPVEEEPSPAHAALMEQGRHNQSFRVIPVHRDGETEWYAPWQIHTRQVHIGQAHITQSQQSDPALLQAWGKLAAAYILQDKAAWSAASRHLYEETLRRSGDKTLGFRLDTEILYHKMHPYFYSMIAYALGIVLLVFNRRRLGLITIGGGLVLHGMGLACRVIILQRPPVSDLYESLLFVGAVVVTACFLFGWRRHNARVLMTGAVLGVILHSIGAWLGDEYETLNVLQAVLDTKFWLATHVLIITTGYAFCLLTSALGHYCLWHYPAPRRTRSNLYLLSLVSLLFICTGTLLGGVWADQSWGRFWGWDPKENGALLIALWLIWLLHGRVTRHVNDFFFVMGMAALSLVVALSWIGVNLLGVGLHSYGFLQGSVASLVALFLAEIAFFAMMWKRHA